MADAAVRSWSSDTCRLDDFTAVVEVDTDPSEFPHAARVEHGVVVYDAPSSGRAEPHALRAELAHVLAGGPGIFVLEGAVAEPVVDRVSAAFEAMIAEQRSNLDVGGDHFAKAGANDRVWNALEKLALRDPDAFVDYYASPSIALASLAWLGPAYQITSQVNVVNPGGAAQLPHRDYHLGFTTDAIAAEYPPHVHRLSPLLTLQGAVAHTDMPIETGPTMYLPHSQKYELGYLAWRRADFTDYFHAHFVQLPLAKGDAVFFNPALFHGAGTNRTRDVRRMANLLQISSAMGRAMEAVDREACVDAVYPALLRRVLDGVDPDVLEPAIAASAEGYAFPTNLDRDQPREGLTPPSQADLVRRALGERWEPSRLRSELHAHAERRLTA
jgi:ectoine hydroxylase-related dioxygenase (phytanoyl-CoA dioxygenase family)